MRYKIALPEPRERDVHTDPVPRLGGVALFIAFLVTTLFWNIYRPESFAAFNFPFSILNFSIDKRLLGILLGSLVIVIVMAIDDIKGLRPSTKLFWQIVAGLVVIASGVGIDYFRLPLIGDIRLDSIQIPIHIAGVVYHFTLFADLFLLLWLVLLMNALNFLDGLDGLATGISWVAALSIVVLSMTAAVNQPATALLALILFGAISGFVPWNWHKAKMFLGDSGSIFLGFILGVLSVIAGSKVATLGLVLGLPILDSLVVIINRIWHGQNPFTTADQTHLHHRLIKAGIAVPQAVLYYVSLSALFGILALVSNTLIKGLVLLCILAGLVLIYLVLRPKNKVLPNNRS